LFKKSIFFKLSKIDIKDLVILLHILNEYKISYEYTTVADYYRILNQKKDVENAKNVVELEKTTIERTRDTKTLITEMNYNDYYDFSNCSL